MSFRTLLLAMVVASVSTHASADPKQPTAAEKQKAAEHYDRARAAYSFGNYDDAIREYQAAFELTTAPEYMFNIAQTQRAKGDRDALGILRAEGKIGVGAGHSADLNVASRELHHVDALRGVASCGSNVDAVTVPL